MLYITLIVTNFKRILKKNKINILWMTYTINFGPSIMFHDSEACFVKNEAQVFLDYIHCTVDAMTAFHNFGMHKTSRINWRKIFVALLSSKSRSFLSKRIDWNCLTLANDGVKSQNFNDYFCKIKSYNFNFFVLVIMKYILYDEIVHNWNNKMNNIFAVIFSDDLLVSAKTPFRILSMIIIYTL